MSYQIFICAASRSGSTLLSTILGNHKKILTFNELHFFNELSNYHNEKIKVPYLIAAKLIARIERNRWAKPLNEDFELARELIHLKTSITNYELFERVVNYYSERNKKEIIVEQTGKNINYYTILLKNYPSSKIIFTVRDSRAIMSSQKNRWKRRKYGAKNIPKLETLKNFINYHPFTTSYLWRKAYSNINIVDGFVMKYEDLVSNPVDQIKNLCAFIEIEFDPNMMEISLKTSSHNNIQKGISKDSLSTWTNRLTQTEIWVNQCINESVMKKFDYKILSVKPNVFQLVLYFLLFPLHVVGVLILNLNNVLHIIRSKFKHKE